MRDKIQHSLQQVQQWVEARNYKGYDPGDGLTSFLRPLAFGNLFAERILQQAIWKSPLTFPAPQPLWTFPICLLP